MDILQIAVNAGLLVTLDGRIGREEYKSVYGSVSALDRFANAILEHAKAQRLPVDIALQTVSSECDLN